jgi:hypothetical protein
MLEVTTIPIAQSPLCFRLVDALSSPLHHQLFEAVDHASASRLFNLASPWYREQPFSNDWFAKVESTSTAGAAPEEIRQVRKWLYQRGIPFSRRVFLSWDSQLAAKTSWKMVVKYWDDLWYPMSDDLAVFDES